MSMRSFREQLLVNTLASGLANVWAMAAALIAVPLLVAGLGQNGFGVWALVMTFSATNGWLSLGDLGVVIATTRQVSAHLAVDDQRGARSVVSNALLGVFVLGLAGGALLAGAALAGLPRLFDVSGDLAPSFRFALVVMGVQVVLDLIINVAEGALEGIQRVDLSRAVDSFRRLAFVISTCAGALLGRDVKWVALGSLAATMIALVVALVTLNRHLARFLVRPTRAGVGELVRDGRTVAALRPLGVIQRTMDRLLVGVIMGPGAVALVELANQLQAAADAVLSASSYSVVPTSAWLEARGDHGSIARLAAKGTKYSLLATVPIGIGVATLAGPFIEIWVGRRFAEAAGLAAVASIAVMVNAPLAVGSQLLLGLGRTGVILKAAGGAIVANLLVSVVLLETVGLVGAMWGTVVGNLVLIALIGPGVMEASGTTSRLFVRTAVVPVLPAAVAQLAVAFAMMQFELRPLPAVLLTGAASLLAYLMVAWRTAFDRGELEELRFR